MSALVSCSRCAQSMAVSVTIILVLFHQTCSAKDRTSCPSSSCGEIRDIKYPFQLKGDPDGCGLPGYEFDCVNNVTVLTLFSGKYHVKEINYSRYEIRVIDPGIVEDTSCSFPRCFLSTQGFIYDKDPLTIWYAEETQVMFVNCSNRVSDDPQYVEVKAGGCDSGGHIYAVLDHCMEYTGFTLRDIKVGCRLKSATLVNRIHGKNVPCRDWRDRIDDKNVSYADILKSLEEGFWLSWFRLVCPDRCGKDIPCFINDTTQQIECHTCQMFDSCTRNYGEIYSSTSVSPS